jgi:PAS domain S-box-containing protein
LAGDRTIQKHDIRSIACIPGLSQGQFKAMLYLEHRRMAHIFTPERVELLRYLSSQFAVSVENALLYDRLNQKIRELQQTERELTEHQDRLEAAVGERTRELESQIALVDGLLDAAGDTIEVFDPDEMRYLKWNKRAREISGLSDEEIAVIDPARDFVAKEDIPRIVAAIDKAVSDGKATVRCTVISKDGTRIPMEYVCSVSRGVDGHPLHLVAMGREITEQLRIEEALQRSEEMYRDLVEKISDIIYAVNAEGVITYLNPAIEALLGLPPEQVVGQPFAQYIHPEDLGRLQDNLRGLWSGAAPGPAEYRVLAASGETRWINVTSQPIVDGGRVTGVQGVLTDITERKRMEESLAEAALAAERERLARELHDSVTQSLHAASLIADALPARWKDDPAEGRRGLEHLQRFTHGALAEMRTLLLELHPAALADQELPVLLRQLADAMMARTRAVVTATVVGDCNLPSEAVVAFYRIAQEALNNVVKHAHARRVRIVLDCRGERPGAGDGGETRLSIVDDGCGFDPEDPGLAGLGIGIMRDRAREIGMALSITSQPGRGTEVSAAWQEPG